MLNNGKNALTILLAAGNFACLFSPAIAQESPLTEDSQKNNEAMAQINSVADLSESAPKNHKNAVMAQINSVSQLKDVAPTDWAYEALRSLVERYGCIVGYPDRTFRGNRATSRWEFAAGLNACLNTIERLIQENVSVLKEDIDKLQRLAKEFETELAVLGTRVDNLENRTAFLEDHQFSTTTKLSGAAWFNLTGAFNNGRVRAERRFAGDPFTPPVRDPETNKPSVFRREQPEITFSYLTWLTFNTSFTGKDSLVTQLAAGNGDSPANQLVSAGYYNSWGVPFLDQTAGPQTNNVIIRELFYQFSPLDNLTVAIGPRLNFYRYFDNNRFTFFLNGATTFNSNGSTLSNSVDRGSGVYVSWQMLKQLQLSVAYLGQNTEFLPGFLNTANDPATGLFSPTNTITGQITFSPTNNFNLRVLYTRSHIRAFGGVAGNADGEPIPYGFVDDGFGGPIKDPSSNTVVVNFDWLIAPKFGIFGRYSYGNTRIVPENDDRSEGDLNVQAFQFGFGFPDVGKEGALGVISFLVPQDYISGRRYLLSGNGNGGTQYELEASYHFPITNNIAVVPAFYVIWNPNNFSNNPTVYVGNIRTQFLF
ncbi:iron uptake porin [Chroococcus sp. FPU101]|uniref:iron uptake porin n=1 Tax=Chroococcus sp. FPU101 TaxID=1974212 RepID=UPI001AA51DAC|nr:iron uptake porin [Chroococcus sp. FPU101]GFE68080.1 conserved exported hypothetical protein [Chroococcus sp. FPU101]